MINAFNYGAPPHGGIAPGIDRIVMLLSRNRKHQRDHTFPNESKRSGLNDEAPSEVGENQLKELSIKKI